MLKNDKLQELEAILFVSGDEGVRVEELSAILSLDKQQVADKLRILSEKYAQDVQSALHLLEVGGFVKLSTKKELKNVLEAYVQNPMTQKLSQAVLETLSIIAYKQPIPRMKVDAVRGVNSSGTVQKLLQLQLIQEKGRLDTPGRPILYGTTDYFMDYFGLKDLEELPDISQMEEEIDNTMPVDLFFDRYKDKEIHFEEEEMPS